LESFKGKGDHRTLGREMGETFKATIERMADELELAKKLNPLSVERLRVMEERVAERYPDLLDEMRGIAEGSKLDYLEVLAYNFLTSTAWACTNIAFRDTEEGVAIGKTNDIGEGKAYYHVLLDLTFPSGLRIMNFTWPGTIWSNAGVNSYGIAQAGASVGIESVDCHGLESNLLQRIILENSTTIDEAVDIITSYPIKNHAANITVADGENLVVVEKGVSESSLRFPQGGAIFATNHWVTPRMCPACHFSSSEFEQNTLARWSNLERLVAESQGNHSVERIKEILRDHSDPGAICQHGPFMHSTVAYVIVPRTRTIHFSYGRPCEVEFQTFVME